MQLVSILMPAYNCENYIKEAIECILNQTFKNWELLIADDASTDKTKTLIDSYNDPRIKSFHNALNLGYLKTWNNLISLSKGDFITFQDADDSCAVNRIELLLHAFENNPDIGVIGSNYNRINETGEIVYTSDFVLNHNEIVAKMPEQFEIVGSGLMIKRKVYNQIGGYNEFFDRIGAEDYYWIYLITEKFQIMNLKKVLYNYRFNENSVMGDLSINPRKLFITEVIIYLINQRKLNGVDAISSGNTIEISNFLEKKLTEIGNKKDQLFHYIAKRRFYEGHKKLAIKYLLKAITKNPIKLSYYRDYIYFSRKL